MRTPFLSLICLSIVGCSKPLFGPPAVETRPKQYSSLLAEWQKRGLVDHFPKTLPAEATNIKLSAFPGFLQGGGWFQLRLALPSGDVARIFEEASKQAKGFYDGGDSLKLVNAQKDRLPGTNFHTADTKDTDFPAVTAFSSTMPGRTNLEKTTNGTTAIVVALSSAGRRMKLSISRMTGDSCAYA